MFEFTKQDSAAVRLSKRSSSIASRSRQSRRIAGLILAVFDLAVVYLAFVVAYWVRYDLRLGPAIRPNDQLGFGAYSPLILPLMVMMFISLWVRGAYRLRLGDEVQDDATAAFNAATITVATIVVITAMLHRYEYSRGVIIYLWVALICFVTLGRWTFRGVMGQLHRRGVAVRRLLVVGATQVGKMIMQSVASRRDLGYDLVGFVHTPMEAADGASVEQPLADFGRFRNLGYAGEASEILTRERVDEVIIALPASAHSDIWPILEECESAGVGFKIVPDMFELSLGRVEVDDIAGIPVLDVRDQPLRGVKLFVKRLADLVLGLLLAVLFSPLLFVTALAIKLEDHGPVLLRQERVGQNGRRFRCYKFRSMTPNADEQLPSLRAFNESAGPLFKMKDDPRLTRVGRIIRRHSIDELPQLLNVFRGEMSLVGPRPALPTEVTTYEPWQMRRLQTRPGITGVWQVSGRSDLVFDEMVMMDIYYIENWSLALDVKILLRTVVAMITGRGAY